MHKITITLLAALCVLLCSLPLEAQQEQLEFNIDAASVTMPLPAIFKPNMDLSGRGFHRESLWPQALAAKETLDIWQNQAGSSGLYRIQYNLWEVAQLSKDRNLQGKLLLNYDNLFKSITVSGGTIILDLFGTPAGMGRILDKKSPPWDMNAFKSAVKAIIYDLSCVKKYNIWYEVWDAPDMDDFFLGRKQEYLALYKAVAESIQELETQTKQHIPVGGPSTSWWFQDIEGNTIATPEKSLVYELIKFCYRFRLPLDFIRWHSYTSDPQADKENTIYRKTATVLIRDWLGYFGFDRNTPLLVTEWNYDRDANVLAEREEKSYITSSYIFSRLKNMQEAGINNQTFFSLEDFKNNKEGVVRNTGVFSFEQEPSEDKGKPKLLCKAFSMLAMLGKDMFMVKTDDEFVGLIATKTDDGLAIIAYNYIDPEIAMDYIARNIALLTSAQRRIVAGLIKTGKLETALDTNQDIGLLHVSGAVKTLLENAQDLRNRALKSQESSRAVAINIKNLKGDYTCDWYAIDSSSLPGCELLPREKTEIASSEVAQEKLTLNPYSAQLLILKKKPAEEKPVVTGEDKNLNTTSVEDGTAKNKSS